MKPANALLFVFLSISVAVAQNAPSEAVQQAGAKLSPQVINIAQRDGTANHTLPDAPSATKASTEEEATGVDASVQKRPKNSFITVERPTRPRVMTRAFLISHAALFGASMADAIATNRALGKGYELDNPILGNHPSPGLVWGYTLGPALGITVLDYWFEKKNPGGIESKVLPIVLGLGHSIVAWHNSSMVKR